MAIIGVGAVTLGGIIFSCVPKKDIITVERVGWEYRVVVEEFKKVRESGWGVPKGGTVLSSEEKLYKYKTVEGGKDENGKTVSIDVPVYKTYYTYEIEKWVYKDELITTNNDREPAYDEKYTLAENERFGKRTQRYYILSESKEWDCKKSVWDCVECGGKIRITHFRFGNDILKMEVV